MFPRVWDIRKRSDIKKVDITEFIVYLEMGGVVLGLINCCH